jgi:chromosome partitioning protein
LRTVAVYNMKGGVGKTTTAVNLAYLAASSGQRTLLWDLDPQAASSFALRVQPRVSGFDKRSLKDGEVLAAAIKATDYRGLDLLPADFAYRKFDRFLDSLGKPERLFRSLLDTLGRDFDLVLLDCPAGFSLVTEGVFAAADAILVPTIPTVLSLRMVARFLKWADRANADVRLAAFLSMVDRRKAMHRRASKWATENPGVFLTGQVPYASVVEHMAVRRLPLAEFAPREPATMAFAEIWAELETSFDRGSVSEPERLETRHRMLHAVESLIAHLEPAEHEASQARTLGPNRDETRGHGRRRRRDLAGAEFPSAVCFVHRFDTERRDLEQGGHLLELRERDGSFFVLAAVRQDNRRTDAPAESQVRIDNSWAVQILAEEMSPLAALEQRLGRPGPRAVEELRRIAGGRKLCRVDTRVGDPPAPEDRTILMFDQSRHVRMSRTAEASRPHFMR